MIYPSVYDMFSWFLPSLWAQLAPPEQCVAPTADDVAVDALEDADAHQGDVLAHGALKARSSSTQAS